MNSSARAYDLFKLFSNMDFAKSVMDGAYEEVVKKYLEGYTKNYSPHPNLEEYPSFCSTSFRDWPVLETMPEYFPNVTNDATRYLFASDKVTLAGSGAEPFACEYIIKHVFKLNPKNADMKYITLHNICKKRMRLVYLNICGI